MSTQMSRFESRTGNEELTLIASLYPRRYLF